MEGEHRGMRKIRVGVIFGGKSDEHEISLASARSIINEIDANKFEVVPVGITKEGRWILSDDPMKILSQKKVSDSIHSTIIPEFRQSSISSREIDVIFPILHGPYGEDGTIQGLLEMAGIPYVGAGVLASAIGMDKSIMKAVFCEKGLPVVDYYLVKKLFWEREREACIKEIENELEYPLFVKPSNLGSSVGISRVHNKTELIKAVQLAANYDRKIIVERAIIGREIEVSVLGNDEPIASTAAEISPRKQWYDYEAKYTEGLTDIIIPAPLAETMLKKFQDYAIKAFLAIDCSGMARVDFFLEKKTEKIYINEINSIPGFTSTSVYPRLWEATGIPYRELITRLIELAFERHNEKR